MQCSILPLHICLIHQESNFRFICFQLSDELSRVPNASLEYQADLAIRRFFAEGFAKQHFDSSGLSNITFSQLETGRLLRPTRLIA